MDFNQQLELIFENHGLEFKNLQILPVVPGIEANTMSFNIDNYLFRAVLIDISQILPNTIYLIKEKSCDNYILTKTASGLDIEQAYDIIRYDRFSERYYNETLESHKI